MSDFGFPTMDDDDRSTASKRTKSNSPVSGGSSGGKFSFGDLFSGKTYQPGNRSYNYYGVTYYVITLVLYVVTIVFLDAWYSMNSLFGDGTINWVNVGLDIVGRSLIFVMFTAGFILVDRFLLHNSFDLRYSVSRFGSYALYGLIPLAVIGLYFLIFKALSALVESTHSMSLGMSLISFATWFNGVAKLYLVFKWWFWLVPLIIFMFQRRFAMAGRLIGVAGYLGYVFLVWLLLLGVHLVMGPQPQNMFEVANNPTPASSVDIGSNLVSTTPGHSQTTTKQQREQAKKINDALKAKPTHKK